MAGWCGVGRLEEETKTDKRTSEGLKRADGLVSFWDFSLGTPAQSKGIPNKISLPLRWVIATDALSSVGKVQTDTSRRIYSLSTRPPILSSETSRPFDQTNQLSTQKLICFTRTAPSTSALLLSVARSDPPPPVPDTFK